MTGRAPTRAGAGQSTRPAAGRRMAAGEHGERGVRQLGGRPRRRVPRRLDRTGVRPIVGGASDPARRVVLSQVRFRRLAFRRGLRRPTWASRSAGRSHLNSSDGRVAGPTAATDRRARGRLQGNSTGERRLRRDTRLPEGAVSVDARVDQLDESPNALRRAGAGELANTTTISLAEGVPSPVAILANRMHYFYFRTLRASVGATRARRATVTGALRCTIHPLLRSRLIVGGGLRRPRRKRADAAPWHAPRPPNT